MRSRAVAILLGSILIIESFFPDFSLSELSALPALWSHYQAHKSETPDIGLIEFLHLHYDGDSKHIGQDSRHHEKLPLSKRHASTNTLQLMPAQTFTGVPARYRLLMAIVGVSYTERTTFLISSVVWQPPKA